MEPVLVIHHVSLLVFMTIIIPPEVGLITKSKLIPLRFPIIGFLVVSLKIKQMKEKNQVNTVSQGNDRRKVCN